MKRSGFTLIEVLIVIVIIAMLAVIIVPRLLGAGREAREASLRAHLLEMRDGIARFEKDCGGPPATLVDLAVSTPPGLDANGGKIEPVDFKGPYVANSNGELPYNPITGGNVEGVDWIYNKDKVEVRAAEGIAVDHTDYSEW